MNQLITSPKAHHYYSPIVPQAWLIVSPRVPLMISQAWPMTSPRVPPMVPQAWPMTSPRVPPRVPPMVPQAWPIVSPRVPPMVPQAWPMTSPRVQPMVPQPIAYNDVSNCVNCITSCYQCGKKIFKRLSLPSGSGSGAADKKKIMFII